LDAGKSIFRLAVTNKRVWKTPNHLCLSLICDKPWILSVARGFQSNKRFPVSSYLGHRILIAAFSNLIFVIVLSVHFPCNNPRVAKGFELVISFRCPVSISMGCPAFFYWSLRIVMDWMWSIREGISPTKSYPNHPSYQYLLLETNLQCVKIIFLWSLGKQKGGKFQGWTFFNFHRYPRIVQFLWFLHCFTSLKRNNNGCQKRNFSHTIIITVTIIKLAKKQSK